MLPTPTVVPPPPLTLLLMFDDPPDPAWENGLAVLAAAFPEAECLVIGHGRPERLAPGLRELAASASRPRVELQTRPLATGAALVAGVRAARAPWVLWVPAQVPGPFAVASMRQIWRRSGEAGFLQDAEGARLFRREDLLQLPRIPGMHRLLPELFARHAVCPEAAGAGVLRRAYVALACTMGLGWTPPRRTA